VGECLLSGDAVAARSLRPPRFPLNLPTPVMQAMVSAINARRFMRPDTAIRAASIQCTAEAVMRANPTHSLLAPAPGRIVMQVDGEQSEEGLEGLEVIVRNRLVTMNSYLALSAVEAREGDATLIGAAVLIHQPAALRLLLKGVAPRSPIRVARSALRWIGWSRTR